MNTEQKRRAEIYEELRTLKPTIVYSICARLIAESEPETFVWRDLYTDLKKLQNEEYGTNAEKDQQ
jgi:hypothetical protein